MTDLRSPVVPAVVVRRTYPVSRERVFAAWTTPDIAQRFIHPENQTSEIQMDVRTGGTFRIRMATDDGDYIARGSYLEVTPPQRLVMSWRWEEDDPAEEYDSLLTLEFNELDGATEVVLRHEKLANVESAKRHEGGWTTMLEQLLPVLK